MKLRAKTKSKTKTATKRSVQRKTNPAPGTFRLRASLYRGGAWVNASTPDLLGAQYHQDLPSLQRAVALARELGKKVASKGLKNFRIEVYGGGPNPHFVVSDWSRDRIAKARLANPLQRLGLVKFRKLPVGALFKEYNAMNPEIYRKVSPMKYRAVANFQREDSGDVWIFHHPRIEVVALSE